MLLISIGTLAEAQTTTQWRWAKGLGSIGLDHPGGAATASNGDVYIAGILTDSIINVGGDTLRNAGLFDFYIARFDKNGNLIWARSGGGAGSDLCYSLALDNSGNVYITGSFSSSVLTLDTATLTNGGSDDVFVAKYDSVGNVLWAKNASGAMGDWGNGIATDAFGNVYITGGFTSSRINFGTLALRNNDNGGLIPNGADIFVAKYDTDGTLIWARTAGGQTGDDVGKSVAVDHDGNTWLTGTSNGFYAKFDTITLSALGAGYFVAKYDHNGNARWVRTATSNKGGVFTGNSLVVDGGSSAYVTGTYSGSADMNGVTLSNSGETDIFIAKYDAQGNTVWAKHAGGDTYDYANGITADHLGNLYVTGGFKSGTMSFDTITVRNIGPAGSLDVFISKYDTLGNALWACAAGGPSDEEGHYIAANDAGSFYVTGRFGSQTVSFDSTRLVNSDQFSFDCFLGKISTEAKLGIPMELPDARAVVMPNPFSERVIITTGRSLQNAVLYIIDAGGKVVSTVTQLSGRRFEIERRQLPAGQYIFRLHEGSTLIGAKKVLISD